MKRVVWLLIALAIVTTGAFGTGVSEEEAQAEGPSELSIAWWGSQNRHDRTIRVIELYMEKNPNVDMVYEFAGWTDYWTKVTTMAAGQMLPDIMQQDYARLSDWHARDLLQPMDPFIDQGLISLDGIEASAVDGGRLNGDLYGMNLGMNTQAVVVDLDVFEQAGLDTPDYTWTWDDFEEVALQVHESLGILGISSDLYNNQLWKSLYLSNGQWAYAPDGDSLGYSDDSIFVDYLRMVMQLTEAGAYPDRAQEVSEYEDKGVEAKAMVQNGAGMEYLWSNQITALASAAGEGRRFAMVPIPRLREDGPAAYYLKPSQFFSITAHSENPEEAARFISFFTNSIEANQILMAERGVPIAAPVRNALAEEVDPITKLTFDFISAVAEGASPVPPPDPAGHQQIMNNVYEVKVIDPFAFGEITAEKAAEILRQEATAILKEN